MMSEPRADAGRTSGLSEANSRTTDNGLGIDAADIENLFSRFACGTQRVPNEAAGTGLGLAIVKSIRAGQGGKISVVSEMGSGTALTITIPVDLRVVAQSPVDLGQEPVKDLVGVDQ